MDLIFGREKDGGVFEFPAKDIESSLLKVCTTPKHQTNPSFLMAIPHDWISVVEPNGVSMPHLGFKWKGVGLNTFKKEFTEQALLRR